MGLLDFLFFDIEGDRLVKYKGFEKLIVVPKRIKTIGRYAFAGCVSAKNIVIEDSVTHIESNAFQYVPMERIFLSKNLESIGAECFKSCSNLSEIRIPGSVREIKDRAFYDCEALKKYLSLKTVK